MGVCRQGNRRDARVSLSGNPSTHRIARPREFLKPVGTVKRIWSRDVADGAGKPLVPIVFILFYHGEARSVGSDFTALFGADYPEELRRYQPQCLCELFNLTATPDNELDTHPRLAPALWAMKYAYPGGSGVARFQPVGSHHPPRHRR